MLVARLRRLPVCGALLASIFLLGGCGAPAWDPAQDSVSQLGGMLTSAVDQVRASSDGWFCQLSGASFRLTVKRDHGEGLLCLIFAVPLGMSDLQAQAANVDLVPMKFIAHGDQTLVVTTVYLYSPVSDSELRRILGAQVSRVQAVCAALILSRGSVR